MSSRYQKVLPQLTPSTSVLDTRTTTPDVTPVLQFAQQLQTNLDELSVIKTPNHLAGDAEFVKRGYLDPINEAKNKAIESFKNNNIAEGVQGLRDIKGFMLQSQQQGGVYSQIENNYNKAAEYTKQLEEGYNKGTYQDWQVNNYKGLINKSKSFNDKGEYVPFELSNPAQALNLPEYFNDLAKDWGETTRANLRLVEGGMFYDMSTHSYVTAPEVKAGLLKFMNSDTKAQSYYKELANVFGKDTADSMFNNAINAAADKAEFNKINPHYVQNPLLKEWIKNQENNSKIPTLELIPTSVSVDGKKVDMGEIPSKIYITPDGKDIIVKNNSINSTSLGGVSGGYRSLINKEKVKKGEGLGTSTYIEDDFKKYPASDKYISISLTDIINNKDKKYTNIIKDLETKAPGLKETILSYPFAKFKAEVKGDVTVDDYNAKILRQYNDLIKTRDLIVNYRETGNNDEGKTVLEKASGGIIQHDEFVENNLKNYIRTVGTGGVIEVDASGNNITKNNTEIDEILKNYDPKKISVMGTYLPGDGANPFAGWYRVLMDNKTYYIRDPKTSTLSKSRNPISLSLYNLQTSNGQTQKLGIDANTAPLFTQLFIKPNKSTGKVLPTNGTMEVRMNPRFNKLDKLYDFDYSNPLIDAEKTSNIDIVYRYTDANGKEQVETINKLMPDGSELNLAKVLRDMGLDFDDNLSDRSPNSWMNGFMENQRKLEELVNNQ
jgi:hypothetical protein